MTLEELAARCEAAEGPDGELDAAIDAAVGWHLVDNPTSAGGLIDVWHHPDGTVGRRIERLGAYTHSLDAAMTLVPEGWNKWLSDADDDGALCELERDCERIQTHARTWPLALTAACLRARAGER